MNKQVLTLYIIERAIKGLLTRPNDELAKILTPLYNKTLRVHCHRPAISADVYLADDYPRLFAIQQTVFEPRFDDRLHPSPCAILSFDTADDYLMGIYELDLVDTASPNDLAAWHALQNYIIQYFVHTNALSVMAWQNSNTVYPTLATFATPSRQTIAKGFAYLGKTFNQWAGQLGENPPTTKAD